MTLVKDQSGIITRKARLEALNKAVVDKNNPKPLKEVKS